MHLLTLQALTLYLVCTKQYAQRGMYDVQCTTGIYNAGCQSAAAVSHTLNQLQKSSSLAVTKAHPGLVVL